MAEANDHDAIVTLVSEMRQLRDEVKEIKSDIKDVKDNVAGRVETLEREKLDKAALDNYRSGHTKVHEDLELRMRKREIFESNLKGRYAILAVFFGALLSAAVSLLIWSLTK